MNMKRKRFSIVKCLRELELLQSRHFREQKLAMIRKIIKTAIIHRT
jgi:hypothetical protein